MLRIAHAVPRLSRSLATTAEAVDKVLNAGKTAYGNRRTVTLIPGDGVGPELAASVRSVFGAIGAPIDFEQVDLHSADPNISETLKAAVLSVKRNGVALAGVIETPLGWGSRQSVNLSLRKSLGLFANVVECKSIPGVPSRHSDVDIIIVRQNTEGEYSLEEHEIIPGVVESLKVTTRDRSVEIAKFAFDYAVRKGRSKVTCVHKANIMKKGDGLFLEVCKEVATHYPKIVFQPMIVDNTSMQLVRSHQGFL